MSLDDYARHITQKYRLAISIAIINTKPENLTIDGYIDEIKKNILRKNNENQNMDDNLDILDISACSDDFKCDSDDNQAYMNLNRLSYYLTDDISNNNIDIYKNVDQTQMNEIFSNNQDIVYDDILSKTHNRRKTISNIHQINDKTLEINKEVLYNDINTQDRMKTLSKKDQINDKTVNISKEAIYNDTETQGMKTASKKVQINDKTPCISKEAIYNDTETRNRMKTISNIDQINDKTPCISKEAKYNDIDSQSRTKTASNNYLINDNTISTNKEALYNVETEYETELINELNSNALSEFDQRDQNRERRDKFREVIQVMKTVEVNMDQVIVDETQQDLRDTLPTKAFDPMDLDLTQCYEDNYTTLSKTIDKLTNIDKQGYEDTCSQYLDANKTIIDVTKPNNKDLTTFASQNNNTDINDNQNDKMNDIKAQIKRKMKNIETINSKIAKIAVNNNKTVTNNVIDTHNYVNNASKDKIIEANYTQYTIESQYNTHYSQSQNAITIDNRLIHSKTNKHMRNTDIGKEFNKIHNEKNNKENPKNTDNEVIDTQEYVNASQQNLMENDTAFNDNSKTDDEQVNFEKQLFIQDQNTVLDENDCTVFDKNSQNIDEEIIPFKILEDMNSIKVYLKRKEFRDYSSGYKSLQYFGSLGSTQSENLAIEQSAFSVFNYLTSCSLLTTTQAVTEEISEVLGQLIDRLHEEEIYPSFLEELLNYIKNILKLLYEEENYVFDVLQKKDEQIQRIILLNKSMHIQKYTIEKINNILQSLHIEISKNTLSDIQNINKLENLCYIFHILQIILPKYNITQSTQSSQDDRIVTKKDISEIWRKKWGSYKEISNEGSSETCVVKVCSDVLNKVVVSAMDGYSLIAYSALKCFNLIQGNMTQ